MRTIPLGGKKAAGRVALVDDEDYELVSRYRWHVWELPPYGPYAAAGIRRTDGRQTTIKMHCLILGAKGIDHRNGDGLDNQRSNLRLANDAQNQANQRPREGCSSSFKGVYWHRARQKWAAHITVSGITRYLGLFAAEEDAGRAYDAAAREAFGAFAWLYFKEDA